MVELSELIEHLDHDTTSQLVGHYGDGIHKSLNMITSYSTSPVSVLDVVVIFEVVDHNVSVYSGDSLEEAVAAYNSLP